MNNMVIYRYVINKSRQMSEFPVAAWYCYDFLILKISLFLIFLRNIILILRLSVNQISKGKSKAISVNDFYCIGKN